MSAPVRIVLLNAPSKDVLDAATPDFVHENSGHVPPMGLLYVASAIEKSRHEVIFLDAALEGMSYEQAAIAALEHKPDVVGFQAMTFTLRDNLFVARKIKKRAPRVITIFGGAHPTIYPKETAALDEVDFAFAGEGEVGMVAFLDVFRDAEARSKVPGIAAKREDGITYNCDHEYIHDMDSIPFPARHLAPYKRYSSVLSHHDTVTLMITSRGCPFNCIFCNRMGRQYRYHSAEYVLREFDEIHRLGIREVFIHDDTFSLKRERVEAICNGLIERGYPMIWEARTRVDCVDKELLVLMKRAGCERLSFGVESGSAKVLKAMRKGTDIDQIRKVFAWCRDIGITTLADFMIGNVDEKAEDIAMSVSLMKQLAPDYVQWSILSPYPNTPIYKMALEKGLVTEDVWLRFAEDPFLPFYTPYWTKEFSLDELRRIASRNYRTFYFRPSFIFKQLKKLRTPGQFLSLAKAAIAMIIPTRKGQ